MDKMTQISALAEALTKRFPEGNDPFKIAVRLAEECGEVAHDLNHYERNGIGLDRGNSQGKENLALECYQVMVVAYQLVQYLGLEEEFGRQADNMYEKIRNMGYMEQA